MEADQLKLSTEHIPFPCSLRELVLDRFAETPGAGNSNAHPMEADELLEYLKEIDDFRLSPWVAIMEKTEAIGDPATPSREHAAIMLWLGKALETWEQQFPLEGRIATQIRRLKPLSAALAIADPTFMQPGAHPLHKLMDTIQARAIGWQSRLDRVGAILEQQVTRAVEESRGWFDNHALDLATICSEFSAAAERDQARAQRMVQRIVETEAGKARTAVAKQQAAQMINAGLEKHPAPEEIGDFLKGPWYTSAQLLLLKFGADSEQWEKMSATTETLLDSLQSMDEVPESRRQHIFEVVTQLPKEMRRWLLSLHHDTEAVNEAMGMVEFAHLRILRGQALDLQLIDPIVVEGDHAIGDGQQATSPMKNWQEGQWFSIDTGRDGVLRVQLVLEVKQSQLLLFTNMAGIKVLQLSYEEFGRLVRERKVNALDSGASFSLCLANAVGIDSVEILDALVSALGEITPMQTAPAEPEPPSEAITTPAPSLEVEAEAISDFTAEPVSNLETEPVLDLEVTATDTDAQSNRTLEELVQLGGAEEDLATGKQQPVIHRPKTQGGFLIDQAEEIRAQGGIVLHENEKDETSPETGVGENSAPESSGFLSTPAGSVQPEQSPLASPEDEQERQIKLPMGVWIGFHDGETPMMARLAVHDQQEDHFIFVNRSGVKLRQTSRLELLNLIDSGLVELLEASSDFREAVIEVKKRLEQK